MTDKRPSDCEVYVAKMQRSLDSPMPWIGVYIAAASLVCSVAMAGDVINGIRRKKLWFPCKFFTMNAASLTVLAVAAKLPVDLTTAMWGRAGQAAKLSSTVFVITVMGNFLTSFASMNNNEILMNITALGILVITIIVNSCIQMRTMAIDSRIRAEEIFVITCMFVLFVTLGFSVLTVPTTKRYLELKYSELHIVASNGEETGKLTNKKLKEVVEKYWVMAETGSPQFVMARSVTCATSGIICLLTTLTLLEAVIQMINMNRSIRTIEFPCRSIESNYQSSLLLILLIQFIGVAVGTVAPTFRWFTTISFHRKNLLGSSHQIESKLVENYWIQRLVEWKERPLPFRIRGVRCRKLVQDMKNLVLDLCIGVQFGIVVASKSVQFISVVFVLPFYSCYYYCKRRKRNTESESGSSTNHRSSEPETSGAEMDLSNFVLQLEGEAKLPERILKNMCREVNQVIQMGRSQQPMKLTQLLRISNKSLKGVAEFESSNVPNCWTLPVVTLTSIAVALPNIETHRVDRLIRSVSEGLSYAGLVEESLGSKEENLLNMKHAADVVWVGIELYGKWLDKDFKKLALKGKTTKETLQVLADIAEKTIFEFQRNMPGNSKVIAANSMYKISGGLLNDSKSNTTQTDETLFEQLSIMIADILGACLTNLPRVIVLKCHSCTIEEREKSVRHAAHLLGETELFLEILRRHQLPTFNSDRAAYIDEWRAFMKQKNPPALVASSNSEAASSSTGELHLAVD